MSPDGETIAFDSNRHGVRDLYRKAIGGTTDEELLFASLQHKAINHWSRDGKYILFLSPGPADDVRLVGSAFAGRSKAVSVSEDGVRPLRDLRSAVSRVRRSMADFDRRRNCASMEQDGHELYYVAPDSRMMAAPVKESASSFEFDTPARCSRPECWVAVLGRAGFAVRCRP